MTSTWSNTPPAIFDERFPSVTEPVEPNVQGAHIVNMIEALFMNDLCAKFQRGARAAGTVRLAALGSNRLRDDQFDHAG